jgi:hypothetical protein
MSLNFKNLNVASLDYSEIIASMKAFLKQEPTLKDLDFDNESSAISLLCNILATGVAYNGVYAQFGYRESFLSTANLLESIVGLAANSSVLLEVKKSAKTSRSVSIVGSDLVAYTPFEANAVDGSNIFFFNIEGLSAGTTDSVTLYSGYEAIQYTDWDFNTQSIILPLTVDPETITLSSVDLVGVETKWTRVTKSDITSPANSYHFTVLNTVNGYLVTANLPESYNIPTSDVVYVKAVVSNGTIGNSATIIAPSNVNFLTTTTPSGGYDSLTPDLARAKVQFAASSQHKCVTLEDYENAILASNILGTEDINDITVANGSIPCQIKVYVDGLSSSGQTELMLYLGQRAVAGINLIYSL